MVLPCEYYKYYQWAWRSSDILRSTLGRLGWKKQVSSGLSCAISSRRRSLQAPCRTCMRCPPHDDSYRQPLYLNRSWLGGSLAIFPRRHETSPSDTLGPPLSYFFYLLQNSLDLFLLSLSADCEASCLVLRRFSSISFDLLRMKLQPRRLFSLFILLLERPALPSSSDEALPESENDLRNSDIESRRLFEWCGILISAIQARRQNIRAMIGCTICVLLAIRWVTTSGKTLECKRLQKFSMKIESFTPAPTKFASTKVLNWWNESFPLSSVVHRPSKPFRNVSLRVFYAVFQSTYLFTAPNAKWTSALISDRSFAVKTFTDWSAGFYSPWSLVFSTALDTWVFLDIYSIFCVKRTQLLLRLAVGSSSSTWFSWLLRSS